MVGFEQNPLKARGSKGDGGSSKRNVNLMPLAETISHELEKRQSDERASSRQAGVHPSVF